LNTGKSSPVRVEVGLGTRSYPVLIGRGLLAQSGALLEGLKAGPQCAVIADETVAGLYWDRVETGLRGGGFRPELFSFPAGEASKSLAMAGELCERLIGAGLDRSAFVVALGGGVTGDLAGFVAAIYQRGVPVVQMPTSVVAQVDSAVGGKTGVNAARGKNLIGAFHQPSVVLADVETLATLPRREFNEGIAEVIKHGVIRDRDLLLNLVRLVEEDLVTLITRNVEIKAAVVAADERETSGERALLNFGHTIGHAVEKAAGYGRFLHGEAVSIGMAGACVLSRRKAGLSELDQGAIFELLRHFELPVRLPRDLDHAALMAALQRDKKFARGEVRFVLTPGLGQAFLSREVTLEEIEDALTELRA
jgi:3-dehydroquinate synthase